MNERKPLTCYDEKKEKRLPEKQLNFTDFQKRNRFFCFDVQ